MDAKIKSNFKFSHNKVSLVALVISVILTILLYVKIELVSRKSDAIDAKLENRIQRIEEELQNKVHKMFKEFYQSDVIPASTKSGEWDPVIWDFIDAFLDKAPDHYYRQRRNAAPTPSSLSLQQIRQEIDKKFNQVCSSAGKLCQTGPPGPPGVSGAPGYPGFKGEKGVPGKTGSRGPLGVSGVQGGKGNQGPRGPQGLQGEKGEQGSTGSPGQKGDVGPAGPTGHKGPIGLKGNKGSKGSAGAPGYPGYKGEKGAPGETGPQGPLGRAGVQGDRGKQGPTGPQGLQGEKGDQGSIGSPGQKGDVGPMGPTGHKGSIGLKGSKGSKGVTGIQGPKGECVVQPKVTVFPEHQSVFVNKQAMIYCWVQGTTAVTTSWSSFGGTLTNSLTQNGVLRISNVTRAHVGSYICTAHTGHGTLKAVSRLDIKEPPVFTLKPRPLTIVRRGFLIKLCCEATGSPPPKIEWSPAQESSDSPLLFQEKGCLAVNTVNEKNEGSYICRATNSYGVTQTTTKVIVISWTIRASSCEASQIGHHGIQQGDYLMHLSFSNTKVYCHMTNDGKGWTLIARFSNSDVKNWMRDDGRWWYDQQVAMGMTTDPSINTDMISQAFWLVSGNELKITRSDDPSHAPLLQTTGHCLGGQSFRSKIRSYGDFRNGKVWSSDQCLGSCTVQYGGQYNTTDGFERAECSGGIQSSNKIGFWCDWDGGDGSVIMIGGGGKECARADHGIGTTETNAASFVEDTSGGQTEYDFGYDAQTHKVPSQAYSLNLWIR